jgi:hypothetical protein
MKYVGICTIYLHTKFPKLSSNSWLAVITKPEVKSNVYEAAIILFHILHNS